MERINKLAEILVNHSVKIKKGSTIKLNFGIEAYDLAHECYRRIIQKGAFPIANVLVPGFAYTFYKYAGKKQLEKYPKIAEFEARNVEGIINIGCEYNTKEFTNIDPEKIAVRSKVVHPISEIYLEKGNWVGCEFPTHALAQEAEMSLEEIQDFVFNSTNIDWKEESKKQDSIKKILDKGKKVQIIAEDSEIRFSIEKRKAIKCDGHHNMPDGEVFIAPVENSVEGHIRYTYPAIFHGKEVKDVYLEFNKGRVAKASASKNEDLLNAMLNTDKGSRYIGEFGIGMNYSLSKFIKNTLFDEKVGGTIHLALGMAYKEGGGRNESAIHWDMIKDLRRGGKIIVDGKVIQSNGLFTKGII